MTASTALLNRHCHTALLRALLNFIIPSERRYSSVTRDRAGRLHYWVCWASLCTWDSGSPLPFSSWVFLFCGSCGEIRHQDSTCHQNPTQSKKSRPDQHTYVKWAIVTHGLPVYEQQFTLTESLNASGDGIAHCHDHQPHWQEHDSYSKWDLRENKFDSVYNPAEKTSQHWKELWLLDVIDSWWCESESESLLIMHTWPWTTKPVIRVIFWFLF